MLFCDNKLAVISKLLSGLAVVDRGGDVPEQLHQTVPGQAAGTPSAAAGERGAAGGGGRWYDPERVSSSSQLIIICRPLTFLPLVPLLTESPAVAEEDEDHSEDNDTSSFILDKVSDIHTLDE